MTPIEAAVFERRQRYWENGYRPLEVWSPDQKVNDKGEPLNSPGKQPRGKWREDAARKTPEAARARPDPRALNTGVLCGHVVGVDVDVLNQDIADRIVHLVESRLGTTPLVRIGRAPKALLAYRTGQPFCKIATPELFMPNGSKAKVEVLAEGQQFVADGIHPETHQPYVWTDGSPENVPKDALPLISERQARAIIAEAEGIIRQAGGKEKARERPSASSGPNGHDTHRNSNGGDFFAKVRAAALSDIAAWARALFPHARLESGTGAWRISSKDLGRHLEEDISIHPLGIQDFGEEEPLTAIDLVLRYGGAGSPLEAALWLCDRLRIDPSTLGYIPPPRRGDAGPAAMQDAEGVSLSDFRAYMPQHSYIFVPTREPWPAASVNARIPPVPLVDANGRPVLDDKGAQKTISASRWLDQNQSVAQMTWAPGEPLLIENRLIDDGGWVERDNITCLNLYRPPIIKPGNAAQAGPWLEHVHKVFADDHDRVIKWLAQRVQRPQEKINHALVLGGLQGIGKDTILEPVKHAIGAWNFREASPTQIVGRFNGFLKAVILRISEAHDTGAETDRFKLYEHMKVYTAAPPDVLRCDEKNLREHSIPNVCGVIITTNHKTDGIFLPPDDRRHYVAWSDLTKDDFTEAYWDSLWEWYDHGGNNHVVAYLAEIDLSGFNAKAPPPKTQAFWEIVDASRAPEDAELADIIDLLGRPDTVTVRQVVGRAPEPFADWLLDRRNSRRIPHRFEECGYVAVRNDAAKSGLWVLQNKRQVIYAKASLTPRDRIAAALRAAGGRYEH